MDHAGHLRWGMSVMFRHLSRSSKGAPMAQFNVNSDDLVLKNSAVKGSVDRIRMEVDAMKRNLLDLQSTWTGSAATNFQALLQEWHATELKVEASLESINGALSTAATQYAQAEEANTRMFTAR